jgi:hypothetical protein
LSCSWLRRLRRKLLCEGLGTGSGTPEKLQQNEQAKEDHNGKNP